METLDLHRIGTGISDLVIMDLEPEISDEHKAETEISGLVYVEIRILVLP